MKKAPEIKAPVPVRSSDKDRRTPGPYSPRPFGTESEKAGQGALPASSELFDAYVRQRQAVLRAREQAQPHPAVQRPKLAAENLPGERARMPALASDPVQGKFDLLDANDGEYHADLLDLLLKGPYDTLIEPLIEAGNIHLRMEILQSSDERTFEGSTVLSRILPESSSSTPWSDTLRAATDFTIWVRIWPGEGSSVGELMAIAMHELELHVIPIMTSLRTIAQAGQHDDIGAAVQNVINGEQAQHGDVTRWRTYLLNAINLGKAVQNRGVVTDNDALIEIGSDIIMGAVNDVMTRAQGPLPGMSDGDRQALYAWADQVGTNEDEYRADNPSIWPPQD